MSKVKYDVFISYKREERAKVHAIAEMLIKRGYEVWWDTELLLGDKFSREIDEVIKNSSVAIILWSKKAVKSEFIRAEAHRANERDTLINVRLYECELPRPFIISQTLDLSKWDGSPDSELLEPLVKAVKKKIGSRSVTVQTKKEIEKKVGAPNALEEIEFWKSITEGNTPNSKEYESYINRYGSDGLFYDLAKVKVDDLPGDLVGNGQFGGGLGDLLERAFALITRSHRNHQPKDKEESGNGNKSSNQNTLNEVLLGASAPESIAPASEFTARFVAYIELESDSAREKLQEGNKQNVPHMTMEHCQWKPGTTVMVGLKGSDLIIDDPVQEFKWNGGMNDLEFDVSVKEDAKQRNIVLKYDVFIEGVRVAKLRLNLSIGTEKKNNVKDVTVSPAKTAFASYSSKDRKRVLDRVSAIEINSGINVFIDCTSLRTSKEWKSQLEDELRNSDLFLLFWSHNAKESKWVEWEWKTAKKFPKEIQLQPLDPVDMAAPPEELKHLHFGDHRMMIRRYMELQEKSNS